MASSLAGASHCSAGVELAQPLGHVCRVAQASPVTPAWLECVQMCLGDLLALDSVGHRPADPSSLKLCCCQPDLRAMRACGSGITS